MAIMLIQTLFLAKHLEPLKGGPIPIEVLIRGKDSEQNTMHFEKCLAAIKGAGVCHQIAWVRFCP
jgi:hypothetical protein